MSKYPSIFNDVIGPEMRGPSSSHTAASWRIARVSLQILHEPLVRALVEFDRNGAWSTNYREQGTVMGMNGGLLGLDIREDLMKKSETLARERGVDIQYRISSFNATHPNTVRLSLTGRSGKQVQVVAVSTGGGAFRIREIDRMKVDIRGDYYELLVTCKGPGSLPKDIVTNLPSNVRVESYEGHGGTLLNLKSSGPFTNEILLRIKEAGPEIILLDPVLPVLSGSQVTPPFDSIGSMLDYAGTSQMDLGDAGLIYEECRSGQSGGLLLGKMEQLIGTIERSIRKGLAGTEHKDRILHRQSHLIDRAAKKGLVPDILLINSIIANVTALMEAKSAMEVIVANPTAGSCGTVGGTLKAVAEELHSGTGELVRAHFASGLIGAWFAMGPGFSAEEHGCQVECGAASGMAAAGVVQLMGGSARQAVDAASMALQNMIGLICDPVADRVEVPCLGKNIHAAMNALSSATMARAGFDAVIPLEEVLQTVSEVGRQMPPCVKCTGKGGLSVTPSALALKDKLSGSY